MHLALGKINWNVTQQCLMHAMEVNDWLSMQVDDWLSMQVDDWLSKSAVVVTTTLPTGASPPCRGHLEGLEVPRNLAALDICISTGKHVHTLVSQGQIRVRVRIWVRG